MSDFQKRNVVKQACRLWRSGLLWLGLAMLGSTFAHAAVLHVSTAGHPEADGSLQKPFGSIQTALDAARAGDVVRVGAGVYYERVQFRHGGTHGNPVILEGEEGAVMDGSHTFALQWVAAEDVAPGVYRAAVPAKVEAVTLDGHWITILNERNTRPGESRNGPGWDWPSLLGNGHPDSGWAALGALAIYLPAQNEVLIRFGDNTDPNTLPIQVGPGMEAPIITINDVDRCVVRNLVLRNASVGVLITNSVGSVVEDCVIGPVNKGIALRAGADRCTLRFNEIFWNSYGVGDSRDSRAWDHWMVTKMAGFGDLNGILIQRSVGGHHIHDNYLHNVWDGISAKPSNRGEDMGLRVHHNRLESLMDDALETSGAQEDCHWHDNIVVGARCAIRIKAPDYGPLYIYRNILLENIEDIRNFGEKDFSGGYFDKDTGLWVNPQVTVGEPELQPAEVYVYHNTGTANAAYNSNKVYGIGTPNYHFFNNLFWAQFWFNNVPRDNPSVDPNWQGDYNVYVRRGNSARWEQTKTLSESLGLDANSLWVEGAAPGFTDVQGEDFSLLPGSPAVGRGVDLSSFFETALPGCPAGYFDGTQPDAGAVPLGSPMPVVPRPRDTLDVPPAGFWPAPDAGATGSGQPV